jgi:hypothetical protein
MRPACLFLRPACLFLLPAVLLLPSVPALGDASDLHRVNAEVRVSGLSGAWLLTSQDVGNGPTPVPGGLAYEFARGRMIRRGIESSQIRCVTDDTHSPRWMTFETNDGTYHVEGDTLTIGTGARDRRPTAFKAGGRAAGRSSSP